jgi:hypothetical protein
MLHGLTYNAKLVINLQHFENRIACHNIGAQRTYFKTGVADFGGVHGDGRYLHESKKWSGRLWRRAWGSSRSTRRTNVKWPIVAACTGMINNVREKQK